MSQIIYTDRGLLQILSAVAKADSTRVKVGVVGAKGGEPSANDPRITVAEVAAINEFGSTVADVPARPAIGHTFREKQQEVVGYLADAARHVVLSGNADVALERAGAAMAAAVRDTIAESPFDPNAEATVKKKGFDHPLVDTGQLLEAIGHELVHGGSAVAALESEGFELESVDTTEG